MGAREEPRDLGTFLVPTQSRPIVAKLTGGRQRSFWRYATLLFGRRLALLRKDLAFSFLKVHPYESLFMLGSHSVRLES